ncbi:MAG: 3-phosphoshikimate 1-carboxyvinyltransferase [Gemmataceae bacterium]
MAQTYPDRLEIVPFERPPHAQVLPPGSKSITNRALVLAALSSRGRPSILTNALESEDTEVMIDSLRRLAYQVTVDWPTQRVTVYNPEPQRLVPARRADLFVANSGTSMRFLTAMVSLASGQYRLDGVPRMRERPIRDLLDALAQFGVRARSEHADGCPPVLVEADGWHADRVTIRGATSSQFVSGLLLAAPFRTPPGAITRIEIEGPLVSEPYVALTLAMLRQWGLRVERPQAAAFEVPGDQQGHRPLYKVEPDASAASYWLALAAILGGTITIPDLGRGSLQGDVRFAEVLARMGCDVKITETTVTARGGVLRGVDVDMNDISDTVMTLAAVACFAEGPTTIRNVAHIRHKETDRIAALATELRRLGATVDEQDDGLKVTPAPMHGAALETYNDHRMAMSLALIGAKVPGVVIKNPGCVAKTYPRFFEELDKLR